jgi:hypothetical protein
VAVALEPWITQGQDLVDDRGIGMAEGLDGDIVLSHIEQFVVGVVLIGDCDALDPSIGPLGEEVQQEQRAQGLPGSHFFRA